jgi:type VI secretion system protein ImpJ
VYGIPVSAEAIANYQVQVTACHARLKDGTLVSLDVGQEPDRVDLKSAITGLPTPVELKEAFQAEARVRVYLAVPKLKLGRENVGRSDQPGDHRYAATKRSVQEEAHGGNEQDIEFRALRVRVLLSTQDLSGYELLPIAQIKRSGEEQAVPRLDDDYIPPLLAIDAWPPLAHDIVRGIYDIIGQKVEVLAEQVLNRGITLGSQEPGDLERVQMLTVLNAATAGLGDLVFLRGMHPFWVYQQLRQIVGSLSIFGPTRQTPEIPPYDHDELAKIFKWMKRQIEDLLRAVRDYEYEQRYFVGAGRGMQVTLEPKWLNPDWSWFVGVNRGNISEDECRTLLSAGNLDWKMGSSGQVDLLFKNRAPGVQLILLPQAPRALPSTGGWLYYQVTRGSPAWNDVQLTQTVAMRFKEELISNLDSLQGQRKLVVSARAKQAVLEFALFAVPVNQ